MMAAVSCGNRRRGQMTTTWSTAQHTHFQLKQPQSQRNLLRKQQSLIETDSTCRTNSRAGRGQLAKGLSVGRSFESIHQKSNVCSTLVYRQKHTACVGLQKQVSFEAKTKSVATLKESPLKEQSSFFNGYSARLDTKSHQQHVCNDNEAGGRKARATAWASTSSLLKSLDEEYVPEIKLSESNKIANNLIKNDNRTTTSSGQLIANEHQDSTVPTSKGDANRINLNIVLSRVTRDSVDSEVEAVDIISCAASNSLKQEVDSSLNKDGAPTASNNPVEADHRRAQYPACSRSTTLNVSALTNSFTSPTTSASIITTTTGLGTAALIPPSSNNSALSPSPSLTIQRRAPLVRAMSAPVRSLDDNSKSVIASTGKRKLRRRKQAPRNISCEKTELRTYNDHKPKELISCTDSAGKVAKDLSQQARSFVAPDVITLVSLISSEGSDSEKEDSTTTAIATNSAGSPVRRAPLLRKTGKSVSFQENFPPNFQLAAKEYSHLIRRGSIAPLAARIHANRPPTAPPVSIFLTNPCNNTETMTSPAADKNATPTVARPTEADECPTQEKENNAISNNISTPEYVFPEYVRSIKERECWKLYQKMSTKGVNVSYDTILRGMLTPTEFRQITKQRELEEAKLRQFEELANAAVNEKSTKSPASVIETLSERLLKK